MTEGKRIVVIGCGVLGPDIHKVAKSQNIELEKKFLPGGLHNRPDELRRRLQASIDEISLDDSIDRIIVGYGVCGKGTVNIHARKVPLVIPRVHDCIAMFLGSDHAYREQFAKAPGTFYISGGWYSEQIDGKNITDDQVWVGTESLGSGEIKARYGEVSGGKIIDFFTSWRANYQRAAFIDTGIGNKKKYEQHAKDMAEKNGWKFEKIPGNLSLLHKMFTTTETTKEILVVPPDYTTLFSAIDSGLIAVPKAEATSEDAAAHRTFILGEEKKQELNIRFGLGIDAGGTYTDVVVHDFEKNTTVGKNKALTTKWDFTIGIDEAIAGLPAETLSQIELVSVSTTLATNAIVEGEGQKTGLIVMNHNGSRELFEHEPCVLISGYINMDGVEMEPINPEEIRQVVKDMVQKEGVNAFAISGFAGSINPEHELAIKQIILEETGMIVTCGHELSDQLNLVVRAQTAVLNARIIPRMMKFFLEMEKVLAKYQVKAPVMVVKGDGTLMSVEMAKEKPVETILSGPAASVAGAKYLTGLDEGIVVDMGGTTTDTAEFKDGLVKVCEHGAQVGGFVTHIRALDMRTEGLGGDSMIHYTKDGFSIGPRRVAPLVWAGAKATGGIEAAMASMTSHVEEKPTIPFSQQIIVAMDNRAQFEFNDIETKILGHLQTRPHTLDELLKKLDIISGRFLNLDRLESHGLVQRCGFTPTDLLHLAGHFKKWDIAPAQQMIHLLSKLARRPEDELVPYLIHEVEKKLALELFMKQLAEKVDTDTIKECPTCAYIMESILSDKEDPFSINVELNVPIIGIGAPIHYFLPKAGEILKTKVIIPEHADVANALGAITSKILVRKKVLIRPDQNGMFMVEGVTGRKCFQYIETAENWSIDYLKGAVRELGRLAGSSSTIVEFTIDDSIVQLGDGNTVFLGRTVEASLTGNADILLGMAS